ncbi:threonine synthase-like 2 [Dendronephthya gigantea]|uniref:threonine synthase-like 2 n=1 Tax=Dendronephthya gigantea TaxID=151771 RepID=UPI00106BD976|nr:threonine synthase-like 2 [Dendronephthya gigantea]
MRYCSTRGEVSDKSFEEILFNNFTSNGGIFMPETIPNIDSQTLQSWSELSYVELCKAISRLFISDSEIPTDDLSEIITAAFTDVFDHKDIIPVKKVVQGVYVAELWHGPTLAFKDLALACVAQFIAYFNKKKSRHGTAIVATSGDTGSAAIESIQRFKNINIICMFPKGACSNVQQLQMTTVVDENVHVFSAEGTSDDMDIVLQSILKQPDLVKKYNLFTLNSGNWARIMIQIVHYFHVYFQVHPNPGDEVNIVVPTGGMGNVTAGCIAYLMGLPIKLTCTTNVNDTVHRAISDGIFSPKQVSKTIAPAMDIQVPPNFERVIFLLSGVKEVQEFASNFEKNGKSEVPQNAKNKMSAVLSSQSVSQEQILNIMKKSWCEWKYLIDPHTATGMHFAFNTTSIQNGSPSAHVVVSTAHIDKFLETLEMLQIEHQPSKKIQSLFEKPTKFKELKKGENWYEIILKTIDAIDSNHKNTVQE